MSTPQMLTAMPGFAARTESLGECFHCGLPIGASRYSVQIDGATQAVCCAGCQAVAGLIAAQGWQSYYRNRVGYATTPGNEKRFEHLDLREAQAGFVMTRPDGLREVALLLEGVTCGACLWLVEQRVRALEGVREVAVNHATRRVRLAWDESCLRLSAIMGAIAALGYGVELYDAQRSEAALQRERRDLMWRLFVAAFGMMQVMMYAIPGYVGDDAVPPDIERLMQWAGLALTAPVVLWSSAPFFKGALRGLLARTLNRDVPVSLGVLVAFAASAAATWRGEGAVYFDSVTMFVFLLLLARYLELAARARAAREQDRLASLVPGVALKLPSYPASVATEELPAVLLKVGDVVEIRPGAAVPADAEVIDGESHLNESLLTGESTPVLKRVGACLLAGSVNGEGLLRARVQAAGTATTAANLVRLMDRALGEKPPIASLADRAASWFVLGLLLCAAVCAAFWWWLDASRAVSVVVALLIITCPCALSLATPAALVAATGALAKKGVLVTRGHALETLASATHFVFDKTGTLTEGRMSILGVIPLGNSGPVAASQAAEYAAALEASSSHPIARALAAQPTRYEAQEVRHYTGQGVEGVVNGVHLRLGSPAFVAQGYGLPLPDELVFVTDGVQVAALATPSGWLALFTLGDAVRDRAPHVVHSLKAVGVRVMMLSGDRECAVARVARHVGIAVYQAHALPDDKVNAVKALQAAGAVVAAVGDGINDAPLLAQAQVSVVMANATALARLSADVVLLSEKLELVEMLERTARRTVRVIRQNLAWAALYNVVAVPLAFVGWVTPIVAAIGMAASSLLVVANAMRAGRTD